MKHAILLLALGMVCPLVLTAAARGDYPIMVEECLQHAWQTDFLHRTIELKPADKIFAGRALLMHDGAPVPAQFDRVEKYPDGSIHRADIWFRTDLPAGGKRLFSLHAMKKDEDTFTSSVNDLTLRDDGKVLEIGNARTAVRVPSGHQLPVADADGSVPGPLLGIKLPNGAWTAASRIKPLDNFSYAPLPGLIQPIDPKQPAGACVESTTEILARGPLFTRARVTYHFAGDGQYVTTITLRSGEPLVRIDESYQRAGALAIDFGTNFHPTAMVYECNPSSPTGKTQPISYTAPAPVGLLVGWNFFFPRVAQAMAFTGDLQGNLVGLLSTDADWLPYPYNQALHIDAGPGLTLRGSLANGHRHWGFYVGKTADFTNPCKDFYQWWYHHVALPLDKVENWTLSWPKMEQIAFPHTFFSKEELPAIRARLQAEPTIRDFMEYRKLTSASDYASAYLFSGDAKYLQAMKEKCTPFSYLDTVIEEHLSGCGYYSNSYFNPMQQTDELLKRMIAMELLLGSDAVSPPERQAILHKLAFVVALMHDPQWLPPNYSFDPQKPDPYPAYVQGTPNQKNCYISVRAMTACLLANHPEKKHWLDTALAENERVMPGSVAPSGVHLESPFYSSRDTMRFGPFWTALTRAGVSGPLADKWFAREKKTFVYLGDLLTPPEPRMGGRRVYHPIGRSSTGVVDPTFMIGADPWGKADPAQGQLMRWLWEAEGKPSPDIMGDTGGRDLAQTLLAFSKLPAHGPATPPLGDRRWEGFGAIFRSQVGSAFESNVVFRHDEFAWNLYEQNNGAVYFYGKGAPLLPRFGGYWMQGQGQPHLMSVPFANRLIFAGEEQDHDWTNGLGAMTEYASLGNLAGYAAGVTRDKHWRRSILFAKDLDHDDPVYLLVRDDVDHPGVASALHWWVLSKAVQPDGYEKPGVVPTKGSDEAWLANLGKNWHDAPALHGQLQHFTGQCGVDLDLFIAQPNEPHLVTDAVGVGPGMPYCVNPKLYEFQQLLRIEQPAGEGYLTLLAPRWPGAEAPVFTTIAGGMGVQITGKGYEDVLFLGPKEIDYSRDAVSFNGCAGFARQSGTVIRLMTLAGKITAGGITLACTKPAALLYDGKSIVVHCMKADNGVGVVLAPALKGTKVVLEDE